MEYFNDVFSTFLDLGVVVVLDLYGETETSQTSLKIS